MKRQSPLAFSCTKVKKEKIHILASGNFLPTSPYRFCKQDHQPDIFFFWSYILGVVEFNLPDTFRNANK